MASSGSETLKCEKAPVHAAPAYKKSSGYHCAVFGCDNNQRKRKRLVSTACEVHSASRESCRCGVFPFHRFPSATKSAELRRQWINAVNRKDYEPSKCARVSTLTACIQARRQLPRLQEVVWAPLRRLRMQNNQRKSKILLSTVCEDHNTMRQSCRCGVFRLHRFPSATKKAELRRQWI